MNVLQYLIKIIGLKSLVSQVWDIVYLELEKLVKDSSTKWDDKTLEFINLIMQSIIKDLGEK